MAKRKSKFIWIIAYINRDMLKYLGWEIENSDKFCKVGYCVPKVRVLDKKFKGKQIFTDHLLLLNYGFFKIPKKKLKNFRYLNELKDEVSAITGWVKDKANTQKRVLKKGNDEGLAIGTTDESYIDYLIKLQEANEIFSEHELNKVKEGDTIQLKEYPFENLYAEVLKIDYKRRKMKVKILEELMDTMLMNSVEIDFENVFFTIYNSQIEEDLMGHASLDELGIKNRNNSVFTDNNSNI